MAKKRRNGRKADMENISYALIKNGRAMQEEKKRKHWTKHDIKGIQPLTPTQDNMFHAWYNNQNICASGSAGTGKSFLALYLAINEVLEKKQQRIIIVRSAVPTREIGHLPGTVEEKMAEYELPYDDIMWELVGRKSTYKDMKSAGLIEFMSTSFIRGLTWDNAIVIVDEFQDMTFHEISSVMTRIGENTRIILTGDIHQSDLKPGQSGAKNLITTVSEMKYFDLINFVSSDIVRSKMVKDWITTTERMGF